MYISESVDKCVPMERFIHLREIDEYEFVLKNGKRVHALQVEPINFNLKSQVEQNVILESYRTFLKQCNFNFQIYVQTEKANAEKHISEIKKCIEYEPQIAEMAEDYVQFIKDISEKRGSIVRKFFVIIEEHDDSRINIVIDGLKQCGNIVHECNKKEIEKLFKGCFKTQ